MEMRWRWKPVEAVAAWWGWVAAADVVRADALLGARSVVPKRKLVPPGDAEKEVGKKRNTRTPASRARTKRKGSGGWADG